MNNKGLTIIELIAILVILGIIATISIFTIGNTIKAAKVDVDSYNLVTLNLVTAKYETGLSGLVDDIFSGLDTEEERMEELVNSGYLHKAIEAQQNNASFIWDIETQLWILEGGETEEIVVNIDSYDFTEDDLEVLLNDGSVASDEDDWVSNNGALETDNYTELFVPINQQEYTITVEAAISEGTIGGYGIFFETTLTNNNPDKDNGYVFQFDRGYSRGAFILRVRENGSELSPVWQLRASNTDLFPEKADDPDWWTDIHIITIQVELIDEITKEATFLLDGVEIGSYLIDSAEAGEIIYTGFRVWATTASFYSLSIE